MYQVVLEKVHNVMFPHPNDVCGATLGARKAKE